MKLASVVIITRNHGIYLRRCLDLLAQQLYPNIEVVVVDDRSEDHTLEVVESSSGLSIKYYKNLQRVGLSALRNIGVELAQGDYIFFTDADCLPSINWVENGMRIFLEGKTQAIEGYTICEKSTFGISNHYVENTEGGQYQTCNIAYSRKVLDLVGGFDGFFCEAYEDIDLALRVKEHVHIMFCKDMVVMHQMVTWSLKSLIRNAKRAKHKVYLIKKHGLQRGLSGRIVEPGTLVQALFPPLILLYYRFTKPGELRYLFYFWLRAVLHRFIVWQGSFQYKVFVW